MVITRDELEEIDPKKTRAIEIQDFVDLDDIDPIYFDHPYYLGPDKGAEKAYALLVKAMGDAKKVAVARFVLRNREHLAAIRPADNVLTMATMRFADEVVAPDELGEDVVPENGRKLDKREVDMAKQLIDSLTADFDPSKYHDEYREELLSLIDRKAQGKSVVEAVSEEPKPTKAPDLMAALEESLAAVRGEPLSGGDGDGAAKKPKRSTAKKSGPDPARSPPSPSRDREARPKPPSRRRRAPARADESRQGALARGRLHQGRDDRLLRPDRRRDPAAHPRAAR